VSRPEAGAPARRQEVFAILDGIHDPCSVTLGCPIGLVGMGIVEAVAIEDGAVVVTLLPTFPDCLFRGVFEEEIEVRLKALPWCRAVTVRFCADIAWDESRMAPEALRRLRPGAEPRPELQS
jgi:metal-sulfur cluster biosynthetic enzyme